MSVPPPLGHAEGNGIHPVLDGGPPSTKCGRRSGRPPHAGRDRSASITHFEKKLNINNKKIYALRCEIFELFLDENEFPRRGGVGWRREERRRGGRTAQPGALATSRWSDGPPFCLVHGAKDVVGQTWHMLKHVNY